MKKGLRVLSLLVCAALLTAGFLVDAALFAFAEEAPAIIEIENAEHTEETPAPAETATAEPSAEPTAAPSAEPDAEPTAAPSVEPGVVPTAEASTAPTAAPSADPGIAPTIQPTDVPSATPAVTATPEPTAEPTPTPPSIDYTRDAGESPDFETGFAELLSGATVVYVSGKADADEWATLGRGVVYVLSRTSSGPDRLEIAYNPDPESGVETAWVDAKYIRPMNPEAGGEVEAYLASCADDEDAVFFKDDPGLPLRRIICTYPEITVELSCTGAVIGVGDSGLDLDVHFSDGREHPVSFKSSKPKYASVDAETGVVTGLRKGSAVITAVTEFGELSCDVTIKYAPRSVKVSPAKAELGVGESGKLSVAFNGTNYGGTCIFESSDPNVAKVDENGVVTGVSKGTAVISVYAYNLPKKPAKSTITVLGPATQLSFTEREITMSRGTEKALQVDFLADERDVLVFSSNDESVAAVSSDGVVRALAAGTAVIAAETPGGVRAECSITVLPAPTEEEVVLRAESCKLGLKESFNILDLIEVSGNAYAEFSFASSKPKYASVDSAGNVTGLRKGSATIRVTTQNGIVRDVKVTVCAAPKSVSFVEKNYTIGVGMSIATEIEFNSSSAYSQCSYFSSDESVATVDASGVITGVSAGTATITVDPRTGKSGSCTVQVLAAPETIGAAESVLQVGLHESGRRVTGICEENTLCSFSYASMDESILRVDAVSGEITTVAPGTAEVVITSHNGKTAACEVQVLKAPVSLALSASSIKIMTGECYNGLSGIVDEGAASALTLKSSNPKVAKIENGTIIGVKKGNATITATTYNGLKASCKVTVCNEPKSLSFNQKSVTIGALDCAQVSVKLTPVTSYSPLSYASSDASVAQIDPETGVISALQPGTATITATALNGKSASCSVTVLPAPETVCVDTAEISMGVGESGRQVYGIAPEGTLCTFSYASSDESVVCVDAASGKLTALRQGTAQIFANAHNGVRAACTVTVLSAPTTLSLSHSSLNIIVGEHNTELTGVVNEGAASGLTLKSSNSKVAKIENGAIVGVKKGSATITATTYNGLKANCRVTVSAAPTSVSFAHKTIELGCGEAASNSVSFSPASTAGRLVYSSDHPEIASVDSQSGTITGLREGTATVTAAALNGVSASCTVKVYPAPASVSFEKDAYTLSVGMEAELVPVLSEGSFGSVSYFSSDASVAEVSTKGVVRARSEGTAVVTVHSYNGHTAQCSITVSAAPASISYSFNQLTVRKGDTLRLPEPFAAAADGSACPASFTFKSSRASVAQVYGNEVRALRSGTAQITVQSHNGLKTSFELVVSNTLPSLEITPAQAVLYVDAAGYSEQMQLRADATGALSFSSSDPGVAAVDENGLVRALSTGTSYITVRAENGSYAIAEITVRRLTTVLAFGMESVELGEMEQLQLEPVIDPGTEAPVRYSTDNPAVATVDENGRITAVGAGAALVSAVTPNGCRAEIKVNVLPGPDALELNIGRLQMAAGECVTLQPSLTAAEEHFSKKLRYESDNPTVAAVDAEGCVSALAEGTALITATTCNGLKDSFTVEVVAAESISESRFTAGSYSIVSGDSADLPLILNSAAIERGYSLSSSDADLLQIDGLRMIAAAGRTGSAVLTLTINPDPAEPEAPAWSISCSVEVVASAEVIPAAAEIEVPKGGTALLGYALNPENLIGTFDCTVENPALIAYDVQSGVITAGETEGETMITFRTFAGTASCLVRVTPDVKYRALIIGQYNDSGADNDLPFAENNLVTMENTLRKSVVKGESYEITKDFNNPRKSDVRALLLNTFAEADEDDVSLIYIVSHGHYGSGFGSYSGYRFSLAPNYNRNNPNTYITANELMSALKTIRGNVVLVLDSCYSGGFIRDCRDALDAAGNIAVLTAQTYDKSASFYIGTSERTTVEFLTYALCYGLGVQQRNTELASMPADRNDDHCITLSEAFSYARSETVSLIESKLDTYKPGSFSGLYVPNGLTSSWSQRPQIYIPDDMNDLVICGRALPEAEAAQPEAAQ